MVLAQAAENSAPASEDPERIGVTRLVLTDAAAFAAAPLHWNAGNWEMFAVSVAGIGIARHYDENVRAHFTSGSSTALSGKTTNDLRDALPAAAIVAITLASANLLNDDGGRTEAYSMIEAGVFASVATELVKYAAGRERPNETTDADRWRHGRDSFPSLHASAAFAIGTVLAESGNDDYRWVRRILGYGIAAATGYERVKNNNHWLSDTVAGAALGTATARFVMHRRDPGFGHQVSWNVSPIDGGIMLSWNASVY